MSSYNLAVVGATGLVGGKILKVLEERDFPLSKLKLLASARSVGKKIKFKGEEYSVEETTFSSFSGLEIALFASAEAASDRFGWEAVKRGAVVIDNSNTFRMDPKVPLIVPEVNPQDLKRHQGLIANPNCSTIQMVVALYPLHKAAKIKRIVVSTYQAVSGWGTLANEELKEQTEDIVKGRAPKVNSKIFPYQIAFNVIPQVDKFLSSGYTKEEQKMVQETKKIMEDDNIKVSATCVRVPVYVSHSEAVNIETEKKLKVDEVREILKKAPGVAIIDEVEDLKYPLPLEAAGRDEVFVGRIREDETIERGLNLWIVSDNLLKGAALNAVQIAEEMIKMRLV